MASSSRLWEALEKTAEEQALQKLILQPKPVPRQADLAGILALASEAADIVLPHLVAPSSSRSMQPPLVGLLLPKSINWIIGALAALRMGCAFVPLPADAPHGRLKQITENISLSAILVCTSSGKGRPEAMITSDEGRKTVLVDIDFDRKEQGGDLVTVLSIPRREHQECPFPRRADHDAPPGCREGAVVASPTRDGADEDPVQDGGVSCHGRTPVGAEHQSAKHMPFCYVLFSSGSTGPPKGVLGTEEGILNRCKWQQHAHPFAPGDVAAWSSAPTFVDTISQVFTPLIAGVTLLILPEIGPESGPQGFIDAAFKGNATHLTMVPSVAASVIQRLLQRRGASGGALAAAPNERLLPKLRLLMLSGEPLSSGCLSTIRQHLVGQDCRVLNVYGSTEAAADCTWFHASSGSITGPPGTDATAPSTSDDASDPTAMIPIGHPLEGFAVMVCQVLSPASAGSDAELRIVSQGEEGQIVVAGAAVASGYYSKEMHEAVGSCDKAVAEDIRFMRLSIHCDRQRVSCSQTTGAQGAPSLAIGEGFSCSSPEASCPPPSAAEWAVANVVGVEDSDTFPLLHGSPCVLTGDIGWMDKHGTLHFLGRKDLKVKIKGEYVDMSVVEQVLAAAPWVADAAVKVWPGDDSSGAQRLSAYIVLAEEGNAPSNMSLTAAAKQLVLQAPFLSAAAIPSDAVIVKELPMSEAGKLMRSGLPHPDSLKPQAKDNPPDAHKGTGAKPSAGRKRKRKVQTGEIAVLQAFRGALPGVALEANHNFFLHGGDSMGAAQVAENLGIHTSLVVNNPTIRSLAKALQRPPETVEHSPREGGEFAIRSEQQPGSPLRWAGSQLEVASAEPGAEPVLSQAQARLENEAAVPGTTGFILRSQGGLRRATTARDCPAGGETDVAAAKHCSGSSSVEMENSGSKGGGSSQIACVWRTRLDMCVDAAPVLLVPSPAAEGASHGASSLSRPPEDLRVICCSHGGDVAVLRGSDGLQLWRTRLPFPADGGIAVTNDLAHVAVASGDYVFFLELTTGEVSTKWWAKGEVRNAPVMDSSGLVWVTSHGCRLAALRPPSTAGNDATPAASRGAPDSEGTMESIWSAPDEVCPAPVTCPPVLDDLQHMVYVASLDGCLIAFQVHPDAAQAATGSREQHRGDLAVLAWQQRFPAPFLAAPVSVPEARTIVAASVDGTIRAFLSDGSLRWCASAGAPCFAPLCRHVVLQPQQSCRPSSSHTAAPGNGAITSGNGSDEVQQLDVYVLSPNHNGAIQCYRVEDGHLAWEWNLSAGPLSSSPSPSLFSRSMMGASGQVMMRDGKRTPHDLWVVSNNARCFYLAYPKGQHQGTTPHGDNQQKMFSAAEEHEKGAISSDRVAGAVADAPFVEATVHIPDSSFTSPVALDDWVFLGCRDDHMYCLGLTQ